MLSKSTRKDLIEDFVLELTHNQQRTLYMREIENPNPYKSEYCISASLRLAPPTEGFLGKQRTVTVRKVEFKLLQEPEYWYPQHHPLEGFSGEKIHEMLVSLPAGLAHVSKYIFSYSHL